MATSPLWAGCARWSSGATALVEMLMLMPMGRHSSRQAGGRSQNGNRFHASDFFGFQICKLGIGDMRST